MRLPAWAKLLMLATLSVLIVAFEGLWLVPAAFTVVAFIALTGASPVRLFKMLLPALPFIIAISALQALLQGNGPVIAGYWPVEITQGGIALAAASALRMVLLYLAGSAVTASTGEAELAGTVERALLPIDRLSGLSVGRDISTMLVLALAFIPIVSEEYAAIKMAQEARGVRYGGPVRAIKSIFAIVLPLLYSLSERADDIALAMEARCYGMKK